MREERRRSAWSPEGSLIRAGVWRLRSLGTSRRFGCIGKLGLILRTCWAMARVVGLLGIGIQEKGQLTQRCDSKTVTAEVGAMDGILDESCAGGDWQTGTRSAASCLVFGVESRKCRNQSVHTVRRNMRNIGWRKGYVSIPRLGDCWQPRRIYRHPLLSRMAPSLRCSDRPRPGLVHLSVFEHRGFPALWATLELEAARNDQIFTHRDSAQQNCQTLSVA